MITRYIYIMTWSLRHTWKVFLNFRLFIHSEKIKFSISLFNSNGIDCLFNVNWESLIFWSKLGTFEYQKYLQDFRTRDLVIF